MVRKWANPVIFFSFLCEKKREKKREKKTSVYPHTRCPALPLPDPMADSSSEDSNLPPGREWFTPQELFFSRAFVGWPWDLTRQEAGLDFNRLPFCLLLMKSFPQDDHNIPPHVCLAVVQPTTTLQPGHLRYKKMAAIDRLTTVYIEKIDMALGLGSLRVPASHILNVAIVATYKPTSVDMNSWSRGRCHSKGLPDSRKSSAPIGPLHRLGAALVKLRRRSQCGWLDTYGELWGSKPCGPAALMLAALTRCVARLWTLSKAGAYLKATELCSSGLSAPVLRGALCYQIPYFSPMAQDLQVRSHNAKLLPKH